MMFMRTILAISLATFVLAVPVAQPQRNSDLLNDALSACCLTQYALYRPDDQAQMKLLAKSTIGLWLTWYDFTLRYWVFTLLIS